MQIAVQQVATRSNFWNESIFKSIVKRFCSRLCVVQRQSLPFSCKVTDNDYLLTCCVFALSEEKEFYFKATY
jgi:hypothetical protein